MILAALSEQEMMRIVIRIIIVGVVAGLLWWLADFCTPPIPPIFNKVAKIIIAILAVVYLINLLLGLG
jgi:uncharacterized membrane protein YgaE (UPF0421/DUF939 family)